MALLWQNAYRKLCDENPNRPVYVSYNEAMEKRELTRNELWTYGSRFADMLKKCGLNRGDIVVCAVPTSVEIAVINAGIFMAGGVVVNYEVQPESSEVFLHCVNKSKAKYLVMRNEEFDLTWDAFKSNIDTSQPNSLYCHVSDSRMPSIEKAVFVCRGGPDDFMEKLKHYPCSFVDYHIDEDQMAIVHLTSGTTGMPKLVVRSHRALVKDGECELIPPGFTELFRAKRLFHNAPWSWLVASTFDILSGFTRVQTDMWHPLKNLGQTYANIVKTDSARYMFLTPPEMEGILTHWHEPDVKFSDMIFTAGYPVTKQLLQWMFTFTNAVIIRYGASEVANVSNNCIDRFEDFKDFDSGPVWKGSEIKTINDKHEELPPGTPGRLVVRSESMFSGYMGEEEKTRQAFTDDGWFLTTDAGYIDSNNRLIIIGRHDYVIKQNGKSIYPATIETAIRKLPDIKEVVVVPVPRDTTRDDICAFIVKHTGSALTENDVIRKLADSRDMTGDKVAPPQRIIFLDSIERNSRGKMNRNELIKEAKRVMNK